MIDPIDPADRLDRDHIRHAAEYAAEWLQLDGHARVVLTPGDMTAYPIVVVAPGPEWRMQNSITDYGDRQEYVVSLVASFGRSYLWMGDPVAPFYAAEKWCQMGPAAVHTGTVVALFLTALSEAIEARQ